jgi:hypothetical protein
MPKVILPASFVSIIRQFRPIFTAPSFENFVVLMSGFVFAFGGHRLTDALRAAGASASKHYTSYYRFFSHARWSLDELGIALLEVIFLSTDTNLDEAEVLTAYSRRWPLERTFQDCKQKLLIENPQFQLPSSVRRSVPFGMMLYSLVVLWYVTVGHREAAVIAPRLSDPWYTRNGRPSFSDMLAALRRMSWAQAFLDLPSDEPSRPKIADDYLARVVAHA